MIYLLTLLGAISPICLPLAIYLLGSWRLYKRLQRLKALRVYL